MAPKIDIHVESDINLVFAAQQGCAESMSALVRRYHVDVRNFLARRTGSLDVADDLAQEVFVAAIVQLDQLKEQQSFKSWLLSIARNKSVDYLRKLSRDQKNARQMIEFLVTRECTSRLQRTSIWESEEILEALKVCISRLGTRGQQLVQQFYFENQPAEAIAARMGQRGSSVRMTLLRIRKSLARCIRKQTELEL